MPAIALKPIILNDIDLKIGSDNYEASVAKCELVPTTPIQTWRGMTPPPRSRWPVSPSGS